MLLLTTVLSVGEVYARVVVVVDCSVVLVNVVVVGAVVVVDVVVVCVELASWGT